MLDRVSSPPPSLRHCRSGKPKTFAELHEAYTLTWAAYCQAVDTGVDTGVDTSTTWAAYQDAESALRAYQDDIGGTDEWIGCRPKRWGGIDHARARFACP